VKSLEDLMQIISIDGLLDSLATTVAERDSLVKQCAIAKLALLIALENAGVAEENVQDLYYTYLRKASFNNPKALEMMIKKVERGNG
jgi:hypothetical protein